MLVVVGYLCMLCPGVCWNVLLLVGVCSYSVSPVFVCCFFFFSLFVYLCLLFVPSFCLPSGDSRFLFVFLFAVCCLLFVVCCLMFVVVVCCLLFVVFKKLSVAYKHQKGRKVLA